MSQLQNCSVMCTKNGSYCENEKNERKSQGRGSGGCVQKMEVIVKRKKSRGGGGGGGGHSRCKWRSEAFVKLKKNSSGGGGGGRVWGGVGGVRVDVNDGEVTLL